MSERMKASPVVTRRGFRRLLPSPILSLVLWVVWLLLNNTVSPGHMVLGAIIAWLIPLLTVPLATPGPTLKRPGLAIRYVLMVMGDIVVSNIQVAIQVCGPLKRLNPGLIAIPLDLQSDLPITLLASTISLTPGTVSADVSEDRRWLYVHALNLQDEAETIRTIKQRYEAPLKEIFGC